MEKRPESAVIDDVDGGTAVSDATAIPDGTNATAISDDACVELSRKNTAPYALAFFSAILGNAFVMGAMSAVVAYFPTKMAAKSPTATHFVSAETATILGMLLMEIVLTVLSLADLRVAKRLGLGKGRVMAAWATFGIGAFCLLFCIVALSCILASGMDFDFSFLHQGRS